MDCRTCGCGRSGSRKSGRPDRGLAERFEDHPRAAAPLGGGAALGLATSNAITLRLHLGLETPEFKGLSALAEYEGVFNTSNKTYWNAIDTPTGRTAIADPRSQELNRAWLRYRSFDSEIKGGRQRIVLDNQRFVGNVGWRQTEQTFDGIQIANQSIDSLKLGYTYVTQVNQIFGSNSTLAVQDDLGSKSSFIHLDYDRFEQAQLVLYSYLLNLENGLPNPNDALASNSSYGGFLTGKLEVTEEVDLGYRLEYARQIDSGDNPVEYRADYQHYKLWGEHEGYQAGLGHERLGSSGGAFGFQTPLGTLHKWNGWADVFLATPRVGLIDSYAWMRVPLPWKLGLRVVYHVFDPSTDGGDFGVEWDLLIERKLPWNIDGLVKFADYRSRVRGADFTGLPRDSDIWRFWFQLEYKLAP